ncbi:uncharacterized protein RHOBADRAFT_45603 [Rhodotorula graminis WP1]|uniref:Uncharacterized protein n=1 Tax=Rhodotorula graminis (strain WP1) TaxID=578459 RepID=A0A0P9F1V4_RHOGW|nr:uncharacterized protein RHOBADRAFT_45603 [Rhodotorula graminis WP1]KPV73642.1 hypothetical protein RHOBADRAFT_45603 [Rhodotorula graminis WP1]
MSLDLAQPRAIRPLVPPPEPPASAPSGGGSAQAGRAAGADVRPAPRARTAVHVRLTEDVLRELVDTARKGPPGALDGALRLDLGSQPAFIVNGVRHALSVHPEAPNTELVRLSSSSRDMQPIAAVTHRANVQHSKADLDKAGQRARENRELAEKEKDSRRAVLLDSAPTKLHARSLSHNRPSRPHAPLGGPASAPSSRTASPASTGRQPSRLTAVPPKPPTSSSFRIGKGTVPSSIALARGASSSSSSGTGGGAASPPRVAAASTAVPDAVGAPVAARQDSASSSTSSSSETSLLQKTSGASVTSPESLTLGDTTKAAAPPRADDKGLDPSPAAATAAKSAVRAGGGLMKGKETLKKEKRRDERAKERGSVPAKRSSDVAQAQASSQDKDAEGEDEDAPGEPDVVDEAPARPAPAKKRRVEADERDGSGVSSSRASSASRTGASSTPAPKPVVKTKIVTKIVAVPKSVVDRGSGSEASRSDSRIKSSKVADKPRGRERREDTAESKASPPPARKKKKKAETDRWYSSSSSENEAGPSSRTSSSAKPPGRSTAPKRSSGPVTTAPPAGSPLRTSTSAAALRASPPIVAPPPLEPVPISSAADFSSSRLAFFEAYATYAVAHSRLADERHRLECGEPGTLEPGEARRLVQDVLRQRGELEALREGMRRFAAAGGGADKTA